MLKLVVLSCVLAATSASAIFASYAAPLASLTYAAPLFQPHNYRGPLSLAPGQPANILGADGRPLDTLDVNLDRASHYAAKALDNNGFHVLKKRSPQFFIPLSNAYYRGPLSLAPGQPANILGADGRPLDTLDVNLDRSAHLTAKALSGGLHYLKKRSVAFIPSIAPISTVAVARTPLISSPYTYAAPVAHISPLTYTAAAHVTHVL